MISNFDFLSVGITSAASLILGFITFFKNTSSATGKFFLSFVIANAGWSVFGYLTYQNLDPGTILWFMRLVMFFAVFQSFSFFFFMKSFPEEKFLDRKLFSILIVPTIIISFLTLSPFLFSGVESGNDLIYQPIVEPGIILFAIAAIGFVVAGIFVLTKKFIRDSAYKIQLRYLLAGVLLMFLLILTFNFVFPILLEDARFIPFGAIFTFPFVGLTAYAIFKHHLLGIKVITTEIITFILAVVSLIEVIIANDVSVIILRSGVFLLVLSFGILLIRSVRKEVQQREQLEKLTHKLEAANVELEKLNEQKSQFLSFASHDLKSPIALIKQFASLIQDGTYSDTAKIKETAQKIKSTAERAITLVENFLNIRKIEEGKMEYGFEDQNVVDFVKRITEDFSVIAKQKNIAVTFNAGAVSIMSKIDPDKMGQVFQNILDNSLKYTPEGSIAVNVNEEQKTALVSIKDTGLGMKAEILPTLFEQFHRDPRVAKKIKGTGLGLYISKQIVLAHHGEIWVESGGEGQGSTFFVRLPKAR